MPQATTAKMGFVHAKPGPTPSSMEPIEWNTLDPTNRSDISSPSHSTFWRRTKVDGPITSDAILVSWNRWMARGPPARQPQRRHVKRVLRHIQGFATACKGCTAYGCQTQSHRCSNPPLALASNGLPSLLVRRGKQKKQTNHTARRLTGFRRNVCARSSLQNLQVSARLRNSSSPSRCRRWSGTLRVPR